MGAVKQAIPRAVPSAVTRAGSVAVNGKAQRQPYTPMSGSSVVPWVPGGDPAAEVPYQPSYANSGGTGAPPAGGSAGAPSVPVDGVLFKRGPIDPHYLVESGQDPYAKVNAPPTRGLYTWVKSYLNHVFNGRQNVDNAGWQQSSPQQRTSYMRITPPALGGGYAPATSAPVQMPQQPNTYRFNPTTGNSAAGPVRGQALVLNSSTYGAGQTAGGIGGSGYTEPVAPPDTVPVASQGGGGMPIWGA
jgi:hypothetical protein